MIPFYIFYSMFGFQRVGDLAWAAGDTRARGFLLGGTAGRTTLNGEGLQHEDGHSHVLASTIPNCVSYDPAYGYEVAVIVQDGLRRMLAEQEDVFYYLTLMNENYRAPGDARGRGGGDPARDAPAREARRRRAPRVRLLGSGTILREVEAAAELLRDDFGVAADVWSVTSFTELRRDGMEAERWNLLHPRRGAAARRGSSSRWRAATARWSPRPTTCGRSPTASGRGCRRPTACSAPTASAASDWRRDAAPLLRGRPPPRRARRADALAETATVDADAPRKAIEQLRDRPRAAGAVDGVAMAEVTRGRRPRHRRLRRRPGDRDARRRRATRSRAEDPLVTLESDKATMDVPAPFAGKVAELKVAVGDKVSEGTPILTLDAVDGERRRAAEAAPRRRRRRRRRPRPSQARRRGRRRPQAAARAPAPARRARVAAGAPSADEAGAPPYASPSVRRLARELGVDLAASQGTGRKGRITKDDVERRRRRRRRPPAPRRRRAPAASTSRRGRGRLREVRRRSSACRCRGSRGSAARTSPATG